MAAGSFRGGHVGTTDRYPSRSVASDPQELLESSKSQSSNMAAAVLAKCPEYLEPTDLEILIHRAFNFALYDTGSDTDIAVNAFCELAEELGLGQARSSPRPVDAGDLVSQFGTFVSRVVTNTDRYQQT